MSSSIVHAVAQIKQRVAQLLTASAIEEACREVNYRWRQRTLGPAETVWAFVLQILHGNTACTHVVRLAQLTCSATAYCQARLRLPLAALQRILERTSRAARSSFREPRWLGHRTFFIDGTTFSMPDTPELQRHFGQPGRQQVGCGFPQAHLLAMFDAATGLLVRALVAPRRTHDMSRAAELHPDLSAGDVLVADRGFCSFAHLALICGRKLHAVFRMHQRHLVSFRVDRRLTGKQPKGTTATHASSRLIRKLGRFDQIVEYLKPMMRPKWMTDEAYAELPDTLTVRELRYRTKTRGFRTRTITLVTTLLDAAAYPAEELAALYQRRWEIETNFAHLKTTMGLDILHCETVDGVLKELTIYALVYNLARLVMVRASRAQQVASSRLSFVDALRWLAEASQRRPVLALQVNPRRPNRVEPRVVKRRPKPYKLLNAPRCQLREQLYTKRVGA